MALCATQERSAYEAGKMAREDDRLFRPGGLELTARAVALADLRPGAPVLDLGCGSGESVRYLSGLGLNAIGIDPEPDRREGSDKSASPFIRMIGSAEELTFPSGSIGAVLAECSLSVVRDQNAALAECARVLVDGGRLIITDLYARRPEAISEVRALKSSCVAGMIVREELETMLARNGFTCTVWEDHSQALRECAARFILEHGSLAGMWGCGGNDSAERIQNAMRAARAGYFLLIAKRTDTTGANLEKGRRA